MFLVWGDNTLARRLANELVNTYGVPVTVIVRSADADQAPEIADLEPETGDPDLRPVLVAAARLAPDVLVRAGVADAVAIALVERDDVANVDAAMMVRELNPTARIVVRVFNPILAKGVTAMLGDCDVLSGSEIAAPAFVAAALGDDTPTYVRLTDEFLVTDRRDEHPDPDEVVCGLAVLDGRAEPETLPADDATADLLLVRRYGEPPRPAPRPGRQPLRVTRLVLGRRRLRYALLGVAALLGLSTVLLAYLRGAQPVGGRLFGRRHRARRHRGRGVRRRGRAGGVGDARAGRCRAGPVRHRADRRGGGHRPARGQLRRADPAGRRARGHRRPRQRRHPGAARVAPVRRRRGCVDRSPTPAVSPSPATRRPGHRRQRQQRGDAAGRVGRHRPGAAGVSTDDVSNLEAALLGRALHGAGCGWCCGSSTRVSPAGSSAASTSICPAASPTSPRPRSPPRCSAAR